MTMQERNQYQVHVAIRYARMFKLDLLEALERIRERFAVKYPKIYGTK